MTFNELSQWYLGLETVKAFASYWRAELALNKFNSIFGNDLVSSIQPADLENYQARRKAEGLADSTVDQEIGAVKTAAYRAVDNGILSGEIMRRFRNVKKLLKAGSNKREEVFTVKEAHELIENCNSFLKPIVTMASHTGMRRGEILNLKRSRLNMKEGLIQLRAEETKNGYPRTIPISSGLMKVLKPLPANLHDDHVFLYKGKPVKDIRASLKDAFEKTGLTYGRKGGLTFHSFRHTFNTDMDEAGVSRSVIDAIRGETDNNSMFNRYNTVKPERLRQAIDRLEEYRAEILNVDQTVDQVGKVEIG